MSRELSKEENRRIIDLAKKADNQDIKEIEDWVDQLYLQDAENVAIRLMSEVNGTKHSKIPYPHSVLKDGAKTIESLLRIIRSLEKK